MEKEAFLKVIRDATLTLSDKRVRIADFVLHHYDRAAFLTAGRLAQEVGVSESTVIRFAVSLGYDGFPALQKDLQDIVREELTSTDRLKLSMREETPDGMAKRTFFREADNVMAGFRNLSMEEFHAVVRMIRGARRVYISGIRASACLAHYFTFQLGRIRENVTGVVRGGREAWDMIRNGTPDDLLIAIAFPRYPRETLELLGYAQQRGMQTAGITDRMASPLAKRCRPTVTVPAELVTFIDLYAGPMALIAALISEAAVRDEEASLSHLQRFEDFVRASDVFCKS